MSFSQKTHQKNALKLNPEQDLKSKIFTFKDQLYLLSNKDFISRNYKKLKKIKENTSKSKLRFSIDKKNDLSLKIKNPNQFDKKMLIQNDLTNLNSSKFINRNKNNLFFSLSMNNEPNNIGNKKYIKDQIYTYKEIKNETKKLNKAKSLINIRNINILTKKKKSENSNNKYQFDINKIIHKENNIINKDINKIKHNRKIAKYPLSNHFSKIKMLYLNVTTRHKSVNFSRNSSINSTHYKKINVNKNKNNQKKKESNLLVKNELKKIFFANYINKKLNRSTSKGKKIKSLNLFNELYNKIIQKPKDKKRLLLRLKKANKSNDYSFFHHKNLNLSKLEVNDLMTSGSIFEDDLKDEENYLELNPEEIHFKAVKYYQEIQINKFK